MRQHNELREWACSAAHAFGGNKGNPSCLALVEEGSFYE
jgi:hypothetical protein